MNKEQWIQLTIQILALFVAIVIPIVTLVSSQFKEVDKEIGQVNTVLDSILENPNNQIRLSKEYFSLKQDIRLSQQEISRIKSDIDNIGDLLKEHLIGHEECK